MFHPCARQKREIVSTAIWAPWNNGSPSATTSNRCSSALSGTPMSRSGTATLTETRPPASRQTSAAALSKDNSTPPQHSLQPRTLLGGGQGRQGRLASAGTRRGQQEKGRPERDHFEIGAEPSKRQGVGPTREFTSRRTPTANVSQLGALNPTSSRRFLALTTPSRW